MSASAADSAAASAGAADSTAVEVLMAPLVLGVQNPWRTILFAPACTCVHAVSTPVHTCVLKES